MSIGETPDYTSLTFPDPPADRPTVIINMVMSVDGQVRIGETERGLGSETDQRLMRELRTHADIVLNGANTLRASGTDSRLDDPRLEELRLSRGQSRLPLAAVVSRSGDLPLDNDFFTATDFTAVVYLSERAPVDRRRSIESTGCSVVVVPDGDEFPAMLRHMRTDLDVHLLLVEGGPAINGELFELGAVDELFLSIGAVVVNGEDSFGPVRSSSHPALTRLRLVEVSTDGEHGEVYLRYQRQS